jgi:membrane fusion protein (multidrug efflux system)
MNLIAFAPRRPFTTVATLMLVVALASGGVLGVSKVRADIVPPLKTPEACADLGSIGMRARQMKRHIAGQFESYFHQQNEQPNQGHRKNVLTSPKVMDVTFTQPYVCQIHAQRHIKISAMKSGYLAAILVRGGQAVKKGDVMFKIITARAKAKADQAKAESDFTNVSAPFGGIVGRLQQQVGSLIKQGDVLTTLSDNSVMWVYFNVPEKQYLEYMVNRKQREEDKIELMLANQAKFPQPGKIGAIDAKFNSATGNIAFRADFPNPDGLLRHGQTGTILIHRKLHDATVIPMQATYELLDKRYVYVVDKDNVVHRREIVTQHELDDIFVIKKGVGVGDRIVLDGIRQVHDGEKVEYEFRPPEEVLRKLKDHAD